jgi:hypothetical protein
VDQLLGLLDFFLWGYVKNIVYQVKINDEHLKARIRDTLAMVIPNMLQAMWIFVMPPS